MTLRVAFRSSVRAAAVSLLEAYKADSGRAMNVYPARPRSINAPHAFIDTISESFDYSNVTWRQRHPTVEVVVLWGLFDSKDAVDQADGFADEFLDWVTDRYHAAGANTLVEIREIEDEPTYVPDWLPPAEQRTYYATRLTLEGFAGG